MKEIIKKGFTNISYKEDDYFIQEKIFNQFNHKLNYSLLEKFSWVPKFYESKSSKNVLVWDFIDGIEPRATKENIKTIALHLKELHNSKLDFPASNHWARINYYYSKLEEKHKSIKVLNDIKPFLKGLIDHMDLSTPLHNDLWFFNMIKTKNQIYIVDWEYASKGDKYFDLSYFIESSKLNENLENLFIKTYDSNLDLALLNKWKVLINALVILWAQSQEDLPFPTDEYESRILELLKKQRGFSK